MNSKTQKHFISLKLFLLFILFVPSLFAQQRPMFTQYMFNGLTVNPAYSAMDEALNVTALARQQWVGFKGAPNTQTFSLHTPIRQSNQSIGFVFLRDQIGEVITENGIQATMANRVEIGNETFLALGLNAGINKYVGQYSLAGSNSSLADPVFVDQNYFSGTMGFGLMLFSSKFFAGFSSPYFFNYDFASANSSPIDHKAHFLMQGAYLQDIGDDLKFKPSLLLKYVKGSPIQLDLNAHFLLKDTFWLGASWRSLDSIDLLAEMQINPNLQLGYSYDFTTTKLAAVEKGSHEIVLSFRILTRGSTKLLPRCYF